MHLPWTCCLLHQCGQVLQRTECLLQIVALVSPQDLEELREGVPQHFMHLLRLLQGYSQLGQVDGATVRVFLHLGLATRLNLSPLPSHLGLVMLLCEARASASFSACASASTRSFAFASNWMA